MAPKFNMSKNPVYQVDYSAASSGKKLALTKRRVRWVFGYSNAEALASGKTGVECRGEEHEVILIWSVTSSKRVLRIDGEDIHYSVGRLSETKFEFSYPIRGGHLLKVVAHLMRPIGSTPDFKQYDLLLDGLSFFEMPRLFQLGQGLSLKEYQAPQLILESKSPNKSEGQPYANYKVDNREPYPDFSKTRAVADTSKATGPMVQENLMYFPTAHESNGPVVTAPAFSQPVSSSVSGSMRHFQPMTNNMSMGMIPPSNPAPYPVPYQTAPVPDIGNTNNKSPQSAGNLSSPSYYESSHSKSSYNDVRNMILDCYELSSPPSLAYSEELSQSHDSGSFSSSYRENSPTQDIEKTMTGYGSTNLEQAFRTLVNLENISKPQPTTAPPKQEPQLSLNQMKQSSFSRAPDVRPTKEVMKPVAMSPNDPAVSHGAMVPYGVSSYSNYMVNPPPLQKVSGFGVGTTVISDTTYGNRAAPHFWSH